MKKIILTGGGTAGHVTPNIALLPRLRELGYEVHYIGSYEGIERQLATQCGLPYYGISSGKLRRYFDWRNFTDPAKVLKGYAQARKILKKIQPNIVFSKGGFVTVPVVFAARRLKIPVIIHESDMTPGLANKLAIPNASKVCCSFPETLKYLPEGKAVWTGSPIRGELLSGDREAGLALCHFSEGKPVVMVVGGSSGSRFINETVRASLPELLPDYQVVHLCGKGNLDESLRDLEGYAQIEYAGREMRDLFAAADAVVSRAGANAIFELLALRKPNLLIPLSASASRGDQIMNARSFERQGFSLVAEEENLDSKSLTGAIRELFQNRGRFVAAMEKSELPDSVEAITQLIESACA